MKTAILIAILVAQACTSQTYIIKGRMTVCTTCCDSWGNCTTTCMGG